MQLQSYNPTCLLIRLWHSVSSRVKTQSPGISFQQMQLPVENVLGWWKHLWTSNFSPQSGAGIWINVVTAVMLKAQHGAELNGLKIIEITFSPQHADYQVLIAILATIFLRWTNLLCLLFCPPHLFQIISISNRNLRFCRMWDRRNVSLLAWFES